MNRPLIITASAIILLVVSASFILEGQKDKVRDVDLETLYDSFSYKQELEAIMINKQQEHTWVIDSLELELKQISFRLNSEKDPTEMDLQSFESKSKYYYELKQHFEQLDASLAEKYTTQIWTQLNQYVQDYGEDHDLDYILGADNTGHLMYARKAMDITNELIVYVNRRYNGEK